ncbi:GntR family transcriptional regulator, partial [Kineococcus glutinatus]|uniref:GntR family transcriptional regulator n=1 Tax=Kineococcus glutinatus TaxID=1070872 RepID=UPI0031E69458
MDLPPVHDPARPPGPTRSLARQIAEPLRRAIGSGALREGERLPSVREVAAEAGVCRGVVLEAYAMLRASGHAESRRGSGTYARRPPGAPRRAHPGGPASRGRSGPPTPAGQVRDLAPAGQVHDLAPGRSWAGGVPTAAWRAAWRQAAHRGPDAALPPVCGLPRLRRVLREHLERLAGGALGEHEVCAVTGPAHGVDGALAVVRAALGREPGAPLA